jgi:hypothetical protein
VATLRQVEAWIEQAEADLLAASARAPELRECHRRYWLQQGYEKAIKAYALMRWNGGPENEREFHRTFLLQHAPLKVVSEVSTPLSKAMYLLRREVEIFVRRLDNSEILLKIDATIPRNDPAEISYRYPFLQEGEYTSPARFDGWDAYQGNPQGTQAAVARLLRAVKDELKIWGRGMR